MFVNRREAGHKLAGALGKYKDENVVVLGIPRGGVVVAAQVADALGAPLDVIIPRKIGAPHNPEVAIGAVAQDGTVIQDHAMTGLLGITDEQLAGLAGRVTREISRRVDAYRAGRPALELKDKTVILVDDGIATGFTVQAALRSIRHAQPRRLVLAVPVAPADTARDLADKADELVILDTPADFYAVGQFYRDFDQTEDSEVVSLLAELDKQIKQKQ